MKTLRSQLLILMLCMVGLLSSGYAQLTPSADSYTNAADPTTNYGAKTLLDVESASQTTYVRFDLSSIPTEYGSANITKATLKLYVNSVTAAGSFNVDYVNGTWAENTITADLAPALGTTIAASVPLTTADKNQYILIDITAAVQAWLSGTTNDGIALVGNSPVNATFDSKESTSTSHAAELDIVFAGGGGGGIAGITTATGSGLIGGGTGGTLNLSLTHTCATNQI
ncbi:MAG TPA: DNRLRE domain-containing protein, partial [Candidatus Binatus sp.]|nr:DNRLRE domain-containing protein [Candidatus Binatus sp.]